MQVADEYQYTDYSSLVGGKLLREVEEFDHPVAGLLWGSCMHPVPMRVGFQIIEFYPLYSMFQVWCLYPTSWNIYFSRIELNPNIFVDVITKEK